MNLDVIQTTAATSADSIGDKVDTLRAELNAFHTEFRKKFQPKRKDKDCKE
jgi:hypothetical protein